MMRTKIEFSEEIETKIISLDYLKIKDELDDPDFQATIRAAYEEPAVINVDNLLDMEIVEDLRLSLSEKERVFRDKFLIILN